jgi:hypothetical protein
MAEDNVYRKNWKELSDVLKEGVAEGSDRISSSGLENCKSHRSKMFHV